jgi:hypothetical protein
MADLIPMLAAVAGQAGEEADEDFNQTVLLLHGDGTNGAQNNTFLDGSTNNFTVTRNGNTTQGTFSPFSLAAGEWSNYFDGTGDYLNVADNAAFATGTSDFTVEAWVFAPSTAANFAQLCGQRDSAGNANNDSPFGIFKNNTGAELNFSYWNGSTNVTATPTITVFDSKWHHVALVRNGTDFRLYIDGVSSASLTLSGGFSFSNSTTIFSIGRAGAFNGQYWTGYISNFRFVNATAVYTAAFTPPTAPLTAITNTSLLTCQSNRFVDNSTNAFAITRNGDVRVTPFSPFAPSAAYSASTNGGSGYFDGTGDYLSVADNAAFEFGSGDFCVELFAYINAFGTSGQNWAAQWNTPNRGWIMGYVNSGTLFGFSYSTTGSNEVATSSSVTLPLNQWNHLVACRSGNTLSTYLNGVRNATRDVTGVTIFAPSQALEIGRNAENTTGWNMNGYISSLRIIKGTHPYDATQTTLTVPSAPLTAITNTSVLLNYTNAGIFDNTGKNNLETVGDAQIDTTTKKFGTGSMEFDGTGDYLKFPDAITFNVGEDFTVEAWLYMTDSGTYTPRIQKYASTTEIAIFAVEKSGTIYAVFSSAVLNGGIAATTDNATSTISGQTWNHVAWVRSSGTLTFYINGSASGTVSLSTYKSQRLTLVGITNYSAGGAPGLYFPFNGFIDDLRITKGVARYTANFTAPTKAFPDQ